MRPVKKLSGGYWCGYLSGKLQSLDKLIQFKLCDLFGLPRLQYSLYAVKLFFNVTS